ncbi:Glutaminase A [Talaromyces pinophilus]|nr:Glutaminase A [Talaromyces pinophilus]
MKLTSALAMFASLTTAIAASTFTPIKPPSQPLAVRSPYLSTWQAAGSGGGNGGYLAGQWPSFWNGRTLGWQGLIRVDGTTYNFMGAMSGLSNRATQTNYEYTATQSIYTQTVNNAVKLTVTFLSPITPDDWKRQSLVFSYMNVAVASMDGKTHSVQIYSDISAEWVSGDSSNVAQWKYGTASDDVVYHQIFRQTQEAWTEISDQTEFGNWYWATTSQGGYSYQNGQDSVVRARFINSGSLANTQDTNYRAISNSWPVFAHAFDLGSVGTSSVSRVFSIGLCQDEPIQYTTSSGVIPQTSLYLDYFDTQLDALSFFQTDFTTAYELSSALDAQLQEDSVNANGKNYAALTTLGLRHAFGGIQWTGTEESPLVWLKEISSDGNMNTVDVIFPAHPAYIYTNATILKLLLDPLFQNQEAGLYPNAYSMHDIGSHYPNATGYPAGNDEAMPLEESGNSIIMALMYYAVTKDASYLEQHYKLLSQWAEYLVADSLIPANQASTDDFEGPLANQTNLAIKGIVGIQAISIASDYVTQWVGFANATTDELPHLTLNYGNSSTWSLLYNAYADKVLNLGIIPQSIYDQQSEFYPSVLETFGIPVDTRHQWSKSDWQVWTAATASEPTRQDMIDAVATWAAATSEWLPFGDLYETQTGAYVYQFANRPVQGGLLAVLVANMGLTV